jgi:hypothetical protein
MIRQQRPAIPARLAARPVDPSRGLPIPYVNEHDDGSVNFALVNGGRVLECVRDRLCGLCGERQEFLVAFVGGPGGFHQRLYTDPPGHVDCARAALDLCPYLGLERHQRRGLTEATAAPGFADMEKAQPVILAVTWAYDVALIGEPPALMFLPAAWMSATRFDYADGRLVEIGPEPLRHPPR